MKKSAAIGWAGLAAYVTAYDYWAIKTKNETLSSGFYRAAGHNNRVIRYSHWTICGVLLKHLLLPKVLKQIDPLYHIAEKWRANGG